MPACSTCAGGAPGGLKSKLRRPEQDLAFLGGDYGGQGRSGSVRRFGLKGRWLWVAGASRSVVGWFDWFFGVCGRWCGRLEFLDNFWSQVFVVVYGGCGACEGEVLVGL